MDEFTIVTWVIFLFTSIVISYTRTPVQGVLFYLTVIFVCKDEGQIFGALSAYVFSVVFADFIRVVRASISSAR